jgi:hypothetical protein
MQSEKEKVDHERNEAISRIEECNALGSEIQRVLEEGTIAKEKRDKLEADLQRLLEMNPRLKEALTSFRNHKEDFDSKFDELNFLNTIKFRSRKESSVVKAAVYKIDTTVMRPAAYQGLPNIVIVGTEHESTFESKVLKDSKTSELFDGELVLYNRNHNMRVPDEMKVLFEEEGGVVRIVVSCKRPITVYLFNQIKFAKSVEADVCTNFFDQLVRDSERDVLLNESNQISRRQEMEKKDLVIRNLSDSVSQMKSEFQGLRGKALANVASLLTTIDKIRSESTEYLGVIAEMKASDLLRLIGELSEILNENQIYCDMSNTFIDFTTRMGKADTELHSFISFANSEKSKALAIKVPGAP